MRSNLGRWLTIMRMKTYWTGWKRTILSSMDTAYVHFNGTEGWHMTRSLTNYHVFRLIVVSASANTHELRSPPIEFRQISRVYGAPSTVMPSAISSVS